MTRPKRHDIVCRTGYLLVTISYNYNLTCLVLVIDSVYRYSGKQIKRFAKFAISAKNRKTHHVLFHQPITYYSTNPSRAIPSTHHVLFHQPNTCYSTNPSRAIPPTHHVLFHQLITCYFANFIITIHHTRIFGEKLNL